MTFVVTVFAFVFLSVAVFTDCFAVFTCTRPMRLEPSASTKPSYAFAVVASKRPSLGPAGSCGSSDSSVPSGSSGGGSTA